MEAESDISQPLGEPSVLYEDSLVCFLDKPVGWLVHPSRIARGALDLVTWYEQRWGGRLHPVNRIDRPVSGLVCFARDPEGAASLQALLAAPSTRKRYMGVARGWVREQGPFVLDYPIRGERGGERKEARSWIACRARGELPWTGGEFPTVRFSLVELETLTGRWHQLRQHLRHLNHPLVGDTTHGDRRINDWVAKHLGGARLLLHAREMEVDLPEGRRTIQSPLPAPFIAAIEGLKLRPDSRPALA